jgi:hypothetical protein
LTFGMRGNGIHPAVAWRFVPQPAAPAAGSRLCAFARLVDRSMWELFDAAH